MRSTLITDIAELTTVDPEGRVLTDAAVVVEDERIAWIGAVAVVLVLNAYLWSGATAFMRAASEAGLLSILLLVRSAPSRLLVAAGGGLGALWLLTAIAQVGKLG